MGSRSRFHTRHHRRNQSASSYQHKVEYLEPRMLLTALTIAQENALPGAPASQWDVSGAGDPTLQGFATDISANEGQTVSFKINDTQSAAYHIDIYRMGYYQGNGARLVASIPSTQTTAKVQPAPLTDSATGLVDCGNWSVTASWAVPVDATSGIYFAKLIRNDTGGASHVVFIVRNDASHSNLLFQTSDSTWEAYNTWGPSGLISGNSLYEENGNTNLRAYKVSYNRPFSDRGLSGGLGSDNWVFHAEYPMVRFLESHGYDVTYFTDLDGDRNGSLIKNHKVFMSVGHDEYWSAGQRAAVTAARDAGVNLAFFSGNEVFWKTRWESSIDGSGTPYRTLVCYKETHADAVIDPMDPPVWTGTWRDPRFSPPADGGKPENALIGTIFTVNRGTSDIGTPFTVPAIDANLRFWRNTSVAGLQPGQTATIGDTVLGYEWDEDLDNGFRPAGLIDMSSTTQSVAQRILDYGNNYGPGTATHSLTLYRAASGALVFGAGTVQWSWGLDANHDDGSSTPDLRMQQATVNLLADMGAQAASLGGGLVAASPSTDKTPPTSTITSPISGASITGGVMYTITGTASDAGGGVVAGVEVSTDGGTTWHPATGRNNWTYSWMPNALGSDTILSRATDDSANTETPGPGVTVNVSGPMSIWNVTTTPVTVDDNDPSSTEVGVKFRSDTPGYIKGIRFYKGPTNTGTHVGDLWSSTGALLGTATFTGETTTGWQTVRFSSAVPINANTTYIASYHANSGSYSEDDYYFASSGVANGPLHALANGVDGPNGVYAYGPSGTFPNNTWQKANYYVDVLFDTTAVDTTPPTITAESPAPNATNVSVTKAPSVSFSKPVQPSTISFTLKDPGGGLVPGIVSYAGTTNTATFTPSTNLATQTTYTATVTGVKDLAGNPLAAPMTWSFTTGAAIGAGPYSLWSPSAAPVTADDPDTAASEIGVKIRTDLAGTISGIRFYKGPTNTGSHIGDFWSSAGTLLATANFTGETASGWQQVNFSNPVAIQPNTTYIASYHTSGGSYAEDDNFFVTSGVDNGPLHALQAGVDGPNGVYAYGNTSTFPNQNWLSANYWVDVVFNPNTTDTTPPTVTSESPTAGATNVSVSTAVTATFSESIQPATLNFVLKNASNVTVASTVSYNDATHTATLTPSAALAAGVTYTATVSGAKDIAGNQMTANVTWSFTTAAVDTTPPTVTAESPAPNATNVSGSTIVTATFSESVQPGTISFLLKDSSNTLVAATVAYNDSGHIATLTPSTALAAGVTYTATVNGATDLAGNVMTAPVVWSFTTVPPDVTPPTVTAQSPAPNAVNVPPNTTVTATFSESIQAATLTFVLKDATNAAVAASVSYNDVNHTATLTPTSTLANSATYTATVSGAADLAGNVMTAPVVWSFTTVAAVGTGPFTIWSSATVPSVIDDPDGNSVELGVKIRSDVGGYVDGIRFYKGPTNTGTHIGNLWSSTGALLATATFTGETASGWQQVTFSSPVQIAANTTYVASYFAPVGSYSDDTGYFAASAADNAPLHALADGADGPNGVYLYGGSSGFPNQTYQATNYWVDVVFSTKPLTTQTLTTAADFTAGTVSGTAITNTSGGELQLAPSFADDFNGTALSSSWTTTSWASGGTAGVSAGIASVAGVQALSVPTAAGRPVEGRVAFAAVTNQQFGMATNLAAAAGNYWAVFGTSTTTNSLYAQVNINGTQTNVKIGTLSTAYHVYKVQPTATTFQFYVDGVLKTTVTGSFPTGTQARIALSAVSASPGAPIKADWVRFDSYASGGTFVSQVFDAGYVASWNAVKWTATLPVGTGIIVETSSGNTAVPDSSWSAWQAVSNGGIIASPAARYVRYRITFTTTDPTVTPILSDITLTWF